MNGMLIRHQSVEQGASKSPRFIFGVLLLSCYVDSRATGLYYIVMQECVSVAHDSDQCIPRF